LPVTLYLIRHAAHALVGRVLAGRMAGVGLGEEGLQQSERLAERLADAPLEAIHASPQERARQTAAPLAARRGLAVGIAPALDEIDFGAWTGRPFAELGEDPVWENFNRFRSGTRPPGGETMLEAQARILGFCEELRRRHPDGHVALVSHADVLKSAVLHWLGVPLDFFLRVEIEPASLTIVELAEWGPRLLLLNETPHQRDRGDAPSAR
jgi:probable phosphoglycerate mutase